MGDRCVFDCTDHNDRTGCTNASYCMPQFQDVGATSSSCTFRCSEITDWAACFQTKHCVFYDGRCRPLCDKLRDRAACSTSGTVCQTWDSLASYSCMSVCKLATDKYSCEQWFSEGCSWAAHEGKCMPTCDGLPLTECVSDKNPHCVWRKDRCFVDCVAIRGDRKRCFDAKCQWFQPAGKKGLCEQPCDKIGIPPGTVASNFTARQTCLEQPLHRSTEPNHRSTVKMGEASSASSPSNIAVAAFLSVF